MKCEITTLSELNEFPDDSREAVAARLRSVREILGMTRREFAERAGISEQSYGPFENCIRDLSLISAKKLRRTYGLSLDFLYFGNKSELPYRIAKDL